MAARLRIVSSPFRLTGDVDLTHLSALVAADATRRWAEANGTTVEWMATALSGDLASQHAAERELLREGFDRSSIDREGFVDRVRAVEAASRADLEALLAELGVALDLGSSPIDGEACALAARTAFVRLYDGGLVHLAERVMETCPRCMTVVEQADADPAELDADVVTLRLPLLDIDDAATLDVDVVALELLAGAVGVVVPEGHPAAGGRVDLPLGKGEGPVVGVPDVSIPWFVVPAHDAAALDLARANGLGSVEVLDEEGIVVATGPLLGLGRYAARVAAAGIVESAGLVVGGCVGLEAVSRCRRCSTVLVPRLGRHWFLDMHDLEVAAADVVREGHVVFAPPVAMDGFLERAGAGGEWCLSHQVEAGQPVPVATCLDCGTVAPSVEDEASCGACMGTLAPDTAVLDARFLAAVWPLAAAGWPADEATVVELALDSTLVVNRSGIAAWAVPMAALGLRLAGVVPFGRLSVNETMAPSTAAADPTITELRDLVSIHGRAVVRTALVAGDMDLVQAGRLVDGIERPTGVVRAEAGEDADAEAFAALVETCRSAYEAATPGSAVPLLTGAVADGIPADELAVLTPLVAPVVGS